MTAAALRASVPVLLSDQDVERLPITVGQPLYVIAKKHLDSIARFYKFIKYSPHQETRGEIFRSHFATVLQAWQMEFANSLSINLSANHGKISQLVNRAFMSVPILDTQESLPTMLESEGYSSIEEIFPPRPVCRSIAAADIRSGFYSGWVRLVAMLQSTRISSKNVLEFRSTIGRMRELLRFVPGNQKSFKEAAQTEVIWNGYTLCGLASMVSERYRAPILPLDLLEEPRPLSHSIPAPLSSPDIPEPPSPPDLVPSSPDIQARSPA